MKLYTFVTDAPEVEMVAVFKGEYHPDEKQGNGIEFGYMLGMHTGTDTNANIMVGLLRAYADMYGKLELDQNGKKPSKKQRAEFLRKLFTESFLPQV